MDLKVTPNNHPIDADTRSLISLRYKRITRAVNRAFWGIESETKNSRYVGSYGRGTAINVSDLDVLIELPPAEHDHFTLASGNGQSRLLQAVKIAVLDSYSTTDVRGDGQVVVVNFSDGMKFEILPAFSLSALYGNPVDSYVYPNTHMGGRWLSTNPLAEQRAIVEADGINRANGLIKDTCKHIRFIRSECFSSYHLSGILIDSFVYASIDGWHWPRPGEYLIPNSESFEQHLLDCYNFNFDASIHAPGSLMEVGKDDWGILGKVLAKMAS